METIISLYRDHPAYLITITTILGLLVGSFLNVMAIRIPQGQSVVAPPSHCMSCKHRLGPLDLIPVISYFIARGRCRYCGASFSPMYAIVEALTGAAFGLLAWHLGFSLELVVGLLFVSILVVITLTDLSHLIIPDKVIFPGMIALFALRLFVHPLPLWNYIAAFFLGGGILYGLALASILLFKKEGMGGGDIKLLAMIGLVVGLKLAVLTLFLASLIGLLFGIVRMIKGNVQKDQPIPFGPFLAIAASISYIWGDALVKWYITIII